MKEHRADYPIKMLCQTLKVGRSHYYKWLDNPTSARMQEDQYLLEHIKAVFIENRCLYGARRIREILRFKGISISRRRVAKLMRSGGLCCKTKRKFRVTTDSKHDQPIAPNLLNRDFTAIGPDRKYAGDITYIPTQQGWLYLATVIDLYSRRVVGWSLKDHMRTSLVNEALLMALWSRKPKQGLLWHTDRGSQYASESHRNLLGDHKIRQSMSRKGNCWDNAVSESFFHTLKTELTHHFKYATREEAKQSIFEYIEVYYNRKRLHSANGYRSPVDYEEALVS